MKNTLLFICLLLLIQSCKISNKVQYLQTDFSSDSSKNSHTGFDLILKSNDILYINVITNNEEINDVFSMKGSGASSALAFPAYENGVGFYRGFKINKEGNLTFPIIGEIPAAGKKVFELENTLKAKLMDFANEINIVVKLGNFRVTILGDVKNPKSIIVPDEKLTIFELMGLAGDINMTADLKNTTILREIDGKTTKIKLDLTQSSIVNSDCYFLKQNDLIYIPPKNNKFIVTNYSPYFATVLSSFSILLSLTTILSK